jgi:cyanophycinase
MIIGGAEDKLRKRMILKEFVAAGGGADARLVVIPTASSLGDEIVEVYDALFRRVVTTPTTPTWSSCSTTPPGSS